ncbi:MAG: MarR family transcriptional regulator [Candidatus Aureabacteria bacterium]|nr:MarR family transcriptional regulator [Candidatus Auribacterota bacterium]
MRGSQITKFVDEINKVMPTIIREFGRRQAPQLFRGKFTFPQVFLLDHLAREGESTMTGLARFMHVSTPAMTGIINRLVRAGYCERVYDPNDRRIIKMRLTSSGQGIVRKVNEERRRIMIDIFRSFSERERTQYLHILRRMHTVLTTAQKT